ncbi:MAG TPA: transcriptional repressor LexA [Candidatus Woesebacteria bacterium]|nr:transcriptional repressor LexA [Candidatus Woesebacteria bacterium]
MTVTIYKRQKQILDYISQYIQKYSVSPTLKQIADSLGVSSLATVHEHLAVLEKKGFLKRYKGNIRGIKLTDEPKKYLTEGFISVPVLGFIAAGKPIEPYTDPNAFLDVPSEIVSGKKRSYVLRVKGDSMIEDGILEGDFVVIEEQEEARNGEIVVALLENGLATLKRYFKEATRVKLQPANSNMSPIYTTNVRIQGKLVGLIRKY